MQIRLFPVLQRYSRIGFFTAVASRIATAAGQPQTFVVAVALILGRGLTGPLFGYSDCRQLIVNTATRIVTFLKKDIDMHQPAAIWLSGAALDHLDQSAGSHGSSQSVECAAG